MKESLSKINIRFILQDFMLVDQNKYLIVIAGPTAVGKTQLAIRLAKILNCEIVSADSRQLYIETNIGTAKPNPKQLKEIPHHFINHLSIHENYDVGIFEREMMAFMQEYYQKNSILIMTGGSGLYIRAVLTGLDSFPRIPEKVRNKYMELFTTQGIEYLQNQLKELDPDYHAIVDLNNPRRLIRALSVIEVSNKSFHSFLSTFVKSRIFSPIHILLSRERDELYERINLRVDQMLDQGLLDEVKSLLPFSHLQSLQTVGYRELIDYLNGEIDFENAIELIKRNSRRYAKRQLTWFRKYGEWEKINADDYESVLEFVKKKMT